MEHVSDKFRALRRRAVMWLAVRRVLQWLSALLLIALGLGLVDFWLRPPGWPRLILGTAIGLGATIWLTSRLAHALSFRPTLSALALRAERMFPALQGVLASGVEFAVAQAQSDTHLLGVSPRTDQFIDAAIEQAELRLSQSDAALDRLLNPSPAFKQMKILFAVLAVFATVTIAAGDKTWIAAQRWLLPLGEAQWPKRYAVEAGDHSAVFAVDEPVRLQALVTRRYHADLRTRVIFQNQRSDGAFTQQRIQLMNDRGPIESTAFSQLRGRDIAEPVGLFECLIDPAAMGAAVQGVDPKPVDMAVRYRFEAGDDQTDWRELRLASRPALRRMRARITPPDYALGLIEPREIAMDQQAGLAVVKALVGSTVVLKMELNKPITRRYASLDQLAPGLADTTRVVLIDDQDVDAATQDNAASVERGRRLMLTFRLEQTVETSIDLRDEYGLTDLSQRVYRFEAVEDAAPSVVLTQPSADQSVLPQAVVEIEAAAMDKEAAVEHLLLEAQIESSRSAASPEAQALAVVTGREQRLTLSHRFDLSPQQLDVGDTVLLQAVARDVFENNGQHHAPARSTVRKLMVIGDAQFSKEIRNELAVLRQQAVRAEQHQRRVMELGDDQAASGQPSISQQLHNQQTMLDRLAQRIAINRFHDDAVDQMMQQADQLLDAAHQASQDAAENLEKAIDPAAERQQAEQARENAQGRQKQVQQALNDLVILLDQGGEAIANIAQIKDLVRQQKNLAQDVRQALPRMLGKNPDELTPEQHSALNELAKRQRDLEEKADALTKKMQANAEALQQQDDDLNSRALAESLREAARIAQRQGLNQSMNQAARSTQNNQLSQAGVDQQQALSTLSDMLNELDSQKRRRHELLRRQLEQLADALEKLVEQQRAQLERVGKAAALSELEAPLALLRRNTLGVAELARSARETVEIAGPIEDAAASQADAVRAMREDDRDLVEGFEVQALEQLETALDRVRKLRQQQQQQQQQQEREQLRRRYLELAEQQRDLRDSAEPMVQDQLNRVQQARLREIADQQADIRKAANELRDKVASESIVFDHMHQQIDKKAASIVKDLRQAKPSGRTIREQTRLARLFEDMAEALKRDPQQDDFDRQEDQPPGAGGGGGGSPALVPPIAELKLLKNQQQAILDQTIEAGGDGQAQPEANELRDLSDQQRDLANLAERVLRMMEQRREQQQRRQPRETPDEL